MGAGMQDLVLGTGLGPLGMRSWAESGTSGDVLIVANQISFVDKSGGIGTAVRNAALMMAAAGMKVRVLYARQFSKAIPSSDHSDEEIELVGKFMAKQGIRLESLPLLGAASADCPVATGELAASSAAMWWLLEQQ